MLGVCGALKIATLPKLDDVLANLLLFAPLGLVLRRSSYSWVAGISLLLSLAIESLQVFLPRHSSPFDVAANTAGALGGRWLAARLPHIEIPPPRALGAASLALAILGLGWIGLARPSLGPNDLSNWELFPLVIGNEATGDRQWRGTIAEFSIYDRALRSESSSLSAGEPPAWADGGPVLWMRFETPTLARVDGPAGSQHFDWGLPVGQGFQLEPDGLHIREGRWLLPDPVAEHVYGRLIDANALSVVARVRPENLEQTGPARIVSLSGGPGERDFTLGQRHRNVVFRVRTPHTGPNGVAPGVETRDEPLTGRLQTLVASFDGERGRIEVAGSCRVERFYPSARGPYPLMAGIASTVAGITALAGLGLAGLLGGRRQRLAGLVLGASAAWLILWTLGAWSHLPGFAAIAALLGLAAVAASAPIVTSGTGASPPGELPRP